MGTVLLILLIFIAMVVSIGQELFSNPLGLLLVLALVFAAAWVEACWEPGGKTDSNDD